VRKRKPTGSDQRSVRATLSRLFAEGLLHRIPYIDLDQERGGITYAYGLSDKGVHYASQEAFITETTKTFDEHSRRTLDHELAISHFHIHLASFCETHGRELYWRQVDLKHTIHPDALFAITDPVKPEGENTLYYFLEIERAKLGHYAHGEPQILRKLGAYHRYYGSALCAAEWIDFTEFRVVIVQSTDGRRKNLLTTLGARYPSRIFWLTTLQLCQADFGGAIFKTPADHASRSYSFLDV